MNLMHCAYFFYIISVVTGIHKFWISLWCIWQRKNLHICVEGEDYRVIVERIELN